jgi:hypothetical protein
LVQNGRVGYCAGLDGLKKETEGGFNPPGIAIYMHAFRGALLKFLIPLPRVIAV